MFEILRFLCGPISAVRLSPANLPITERFSPIVKTWQEYSHDSVHSCTTDIRARVHAYPKWDVHLGCHKSHPSGRDVSIKRS